MEKIQPTVQFAGIELIEKSLARRTENRDFSASFSFNVKVDSKVNPGQKTILVFVDIEVMEPGQESYSGRIGIVCAYIVENFGEAIEKISDHEFRVPPDLDILIKTMSLSTARGVLFSEFRGTFLTGAVLPIIILATPPEKRAEPVEADQK